MKLIADAVPGEYCYYDFVVSVEMIFKNRHFEDQIKYFKLHASSLNVLVLSITVHETNENILHESKTFRVNCIKLAEPDISQLRRFLKS